MQIRSLDREGPLRRAWQPTPVFFPGESHGQRSLVGYSPYGSKELYTTEVTEHACKKILYEMRLWKRERSVSSSRTINVNKNIYFSEICHCCFFSLSHLQPHGLQHIRLSCASPFPRVCSNSFSLSQWWHSTIPPSPNAIIISFPYGTVSTEYYYRLSHILKGPPSSWNV